jgi:SNF2 family DNA or RNA helicase
MYIDPSKYAHPGTPHTHQQSAYEFVTRLFTEDVSPGAALLMEMGTGRTLTTIGVAGALWLTGRIKRLLIVAPLSILGVWEQEFMRFAAFRYDLAVLSGTGAKKADTLRAMTGTASLQVAVVNYESAWRMKSDNQVWRPDLVVCDEGHKIKSHSTNASKSMHRVGAAARYRLLLTSTPVTNKALDIFSQYKFLNPEIFGKSFYAFRNRYFDMTGYGAHARDEAAHGTRIYATTAQYRVPGDKGRMP